MLIIMFIFVNLIVALVYMKYQKRLHPIQAAACYMIFVIYTHDYLVIPSINLGDWVLPKRIDYGLIITLNAILAGPVIALLFLERFTVARNCLQKIIILIVWVSLSVFGEYVHHWLRLVYHQNWEISFSIMIWFILGILLIMTSSIIKKMIMKIGDAK